MEGADFSGILAGLSAATIVGAIIGAGALKALPGFVKWGVNKVAKFFG